jgi:hypothetical protein
VPRIGITGHSNLAPEAVPLVANALRTLLASIDGPVTGVSCLARGADQLFARVVLESGGDVEVVLPAADYRERKVKPDNATEFTDLIRKATAVTVMPFETSNRDAYAAAGEHVMNTVDAMVAVWDGAPAVGKGGTGNTVAAAQERGLPVTVVWPEGATRS